MLEALFTCKRCGAAHRTGVEIENLSGMDRGGFMAVPIPKVEPTLNDWKRPINSSPDKTLGKVWLCQSCLNGYRTLIDNLCTTGSRQLKEFLKV